MNNVCLQRFLLFLWIQMPNKCNVVLCKGNYNKDDSCRVFRLPKDQSERHLWLLLIQISFSFVRNTGVLTLFSLNYLVVLRDLRSLPGLQCSCFMSIICKTCTSPGEGWRQTTEAFSLEGYDYFTWKWPTEALQELNYLKIGRKVCVSVHDKFQWV